MKFNRFISRLPIMVTAMAAIHIINLFSMCKYVLPCSEALLNASRDSAIAQAGVTERTGRNDGVQIEEYQKSAGIGKGSPYCAAGQYWCFERACEDIGIDRMNIPIIKSGVANEIYDAAVKNGRKSEYKVSVHDLVVWKNAASFSGHIERVIETGKSGWVITVGFNTSNEAWGLQKEGNGVFLKKRNIFHPLGRMLIRGLIGFEAERRIRD